MFLSNEFPARLVLPSPRYMHRCHHNYIGFLPLTVGEECIPPWKDKSGCYAPEQRKESLGCCLKRNTPAELKGAKNRTYSLQIIFINSRNIRSLDRC